MLAKLIVIAGAVCTIVAVSVSRAPSLVRKTNAEWLIAGLPPNPPTRRSRTALARSVPSGSPTLTQGYIKLTETATGADYGFLCKVLNSHGQSGATTDPQQRAVVSINLADAAKGHSNIVVTNGASSHPYLGDIVSPYSSSSNLQRGGSKYMYVGQTEASPANAPATHLGSSYNDAMGLSQAVESAIWSYDAVSGTLYAQWINTDYSLPTTYIGLTADDVMVLSGDQDTFVRICGAATWLTLTFVLL